MLVIIPCGKAKIWNRKPNAGPTMAKDAYVGSPFLVSRRYAESLGADWLILSAKYGFLKPETVIQDYDVTFANPISATTLLSQVREMKLARYENVIALGGRDYTSRVVEAFVGTPVRIEIPTEGQSLFVAMATTSRMTSEKTPSLSRESARQPSLGTSHSTLGKVSTESLRTGLAAILETARVAGRSHVDIVSGELHKALVGSTSGSHQMPQCCNAMYQMMKLGDEIIESPPKGKGARLTIRYWLR